MSLLLERDAFCLLDRLDFSRGGYLEESVGSGRRGRGHDFILQIALPPPPTEPPLHFSANVDEVFLSQA